MDLDFNDKNNLKKIKPYIDAEFKAPNYVKWKAEDQFQIISSLSNLKKVPKEYEDLKDKARKLLAGYFKFLITGIEKEEMPKEMKELFDGFIGDS